MTPLEYGHDPRRRRRVRRALILLTLLALSAVALRWGPAARRQALVLLDQRRCMNYRAAPDRVVYETPLNRDGLREKVTVCVAPPCWTRFRSGTAPAAVVFLHERTSPSGNRRLVCLEAEPELRYTYAGPSIHPTWHFRVIVPGAGMRPPADVPVYPYDVGHDPFFILGPDRVYAGQPDDSDPSHFVFEYQSGDERRVMDGWLRDDDTLKFKLRSTASGE